MAEGVLIDGKYYPIGTEAMPIPIWNWLDPVGQGLGFQPGSGSYNRTRTEDVDLMVWHWTGGEGKPDQVVRTLKKRRLGVHFIVGRNGILQCADPAVVTCAHAGKVNGRSVGVEMVNYGFRRMKPWEWNRHTGNYLRIPKSGRGRSTQVVRMHGRKLRLADFTPFQTRIACELGMVVGDAVGLPPVVPEQGPDKSGVADLKGFRGHVGHYMLRRGKVDPGRPFMDALQGRLAG